MSKDKRSKQITSPVLTLMTSNCAQSWGELDFSLSLEGKNLLIGPVPWRGRVASDSLNSLFKNGFFPPQMVCLLISEHAFWI